MVFINFGNIMAIIKLFLPISYFLSPFHPSYLDSSCLLDCWCCPTGHSDSIHFFSSFFASLWEDFIAVSSVLLIYHLQCLIFCLVCSLSVHCGLNTGRMLGEITWLSFSSLTDHCPALPVLCSVLFCKNKKKNSV